MRTVGVFSQKGGSGKSTVSIHLAVMASRGQRVLLIDADPQGTTSAWGMARAKNTPLVVKADPSSLDEVILAARKEGYETVLVDCPPHAVAGTVSLLRCVDYVVTPVQPTMPDMVAMQRTYALVRAAEKPILFAINRAPARAIEVDQVRQALEKVGSVAPVAIGERRAYARALTDSLAVCEYARHDEKAVVEIFQLWHWLDSQFLEMENVKTS